MRMKYIRVKVRKAGQGSTRINGSPVCSSGC